MQNSKSTNNESVANLRINESPIRHSIIRLFVKNSLFADRKGFTLLETIVALAVIVAAMAGPITLATRGIFSAKFAKNKLVAANLSQEGLELIRKLRDDNILAIRSWDFGIGVGDWQADIIGPPGLSAYTGASMLRDTTSGIYNYTSGNPTLFVRKITITKPSTNEMAVVSEVAWSEGGLSRKMTLREILYNWK